MGGKFHLKLNNGERPIANKYREGKMKRTLKRELKVLEIAKREALSASDMRGQTACALERVREQLATLLVCSLRWCAPRVCASVKINSACGRRREEGRRLTPLL